MFYIYINTHTHTHTRLFISLSIYCFFIFTITLLKCCMFSLVNIHGEIFHEKLHDLQSFCWSRNSSPLMQPAVHWRRNCPPPVLILSQTNPIRARKILLSTLMLSSNQRLGIPSSLYPSSLLTAVFFSFASSFACTAHPMFLDFISSHIVRYSSWTPLTNAQLCCR